MPQDIIFAREYAADCREEQLALLRTLGRIPAPTGEEDRRAAFVRDWLLAQGAQRVEIDGAKNVLCHLGPEKGALTVFAAHTDLVFPDRDPLPLTEDGARIYAPGIGDDTANLVNLLLAGRYLLRRQKKLKGGILLAANSGEEGLGNLRGTRAIFDRYGDRICSFVSFDLYLGQVITQAVGSYRYQITCRGPGGHSYHDYGAPNPIRVLGNVTEALYQRTEEALGRATCNAGVISGGTGVNAIPAQGELLWEFRSISQPLLEQLDRATARVLAAHQEPGLTLSARLLGTRPGGRGGESAGQTALREQAVQVLRQAGWTGPMDFRPASTDSNIPLSLGIPALTLGAVSGGGLHTRGEWVEKDSLTTGLTVALGLMDSWLGDGPSGKK